MEIILHEDEIIEILKKHVRDMGMDVKAVTYNDIGGNVQFEVEPEKKVTPVPPLNVPIPRSGEAVPLPHVEPWYPKPQPWDNKIMCDSDKYHVTLTSK